MGNCECLPVKECQQCQNILTQKSSNINIVEPKSERNGDKTSLMSFSKMSMSNMSDFKTNRTESEKSVPAGSYSRAGTSMIASLVEDIEGRCELQV